jgi:hypothetical protein
MSNPYFNPGRNPYDMGTAVDFEIPAEAYPTWKPDPGTTFNWADQEEKEPTFGERFSDALKEGVGSYTKRFAGAGEKTGGNITSVKAAGDTVADLGGGNTLFAPDTTTAMRMAQAGQQQQSSGGFGRMAGSILGQAGGAALGSTVGGAFGSALGPLGAIAGSALGGLI